MLGDNRTGRPGLPVHPIARSLCGAHSCWAATGPGPALEAARTGRRPPLCSVCPVLPTPAGGAVPRVPLF